MSIGIALSTLSAQLGGSNGGLDKSPILPLENSRGSSHASLPRRRRNKTDSLDADDAKIAASYSRYSSSQQSDSSIEDQQRKCRERAEQDGVRILPQFEFSDAAISGTKLRRAGLDRLLEEARRREFSIVYFHSLSRLARESLISMQVLKTLVHVHKIRVIVVTEGIDSANESWDLLATMFSLQHEHYVKELSVNVFRGQEGTVLQGFSVGDFRFGYTSVPSPGGEFVGRGRDLKYRMVYAVEPEQADWVRRIFKWYVVDRQTIAWIIRELNQNNVPKDHRSTETKWSRDNVIGILHSPKYVGLWPWGRLKNVRNPNTGQVTQEERDAEETEEYTREFPDLRIVDDETFAAAQKLLDQSSENCRQNRNQKGQLTGSPKGLGRSHLLAGIIQCSCGSNLHVGGSQAAYLFCPNARDGKCDCRTQLPRERAIEEILTAIGEKILVNPIWWTAVYDAVVESWRRATTNQPDERGGLEKQIGVCEQRIQRLLDAIENSDQLDPGIHARLDERRREKLTLERSLRNLESKVVPPQTPPTLDWVQQQLAQLGRALHAATPAAAEALRNLLDGPIRLEEILVENRTRRFWRGKFTIRVGTVLRAVGASVPTTGRESHCENDVTSEITLDIRRPTQVEEKGDEAWMLYQEGLPNFEIAKRIGVSKSKVTAILQLAAQKRGLPLEDGRHRRHHLEYKTEAQLRHTRLIDDVKRLWDDQMELSQIAAKLGVCRDTVTKAIAEWHTAHGLPVPDGRSRRWQLSCYGRDNHSVCGSENDTHAV